MSIQPTETESADDFSGINFLLGLVVGVAMTFTWWQLMDLLQVSSVRNPQSASFSEEMLASLRNLPTGFWLGVIYLWQKPSQLSLLRRIGLALKGALLGGLLYLCFNATLHSIELLIGKPYGEWISMAVSGTLLAGAISSANVAGRKTEAKTSSFKQYWLLLKKLDRSAVREVTVWTSVGTLTGLAVGMGVSGASAWFLPLAIAILLTVLGLWLTRPAIIVDHTRRNNAIHAILSLVAIVGPILLMTFNVQLGLMVLVGEILLYAVITLRK